jgi:hypothetical protein
VVAGTLGRITSRRGHGDHDDAERQHRQSHEFENKSVHGNLPKPIDKVAR